MKWGWSIVLVGLLIRSIYGANLDPLLAAETPIVIHELAWAGSSLSANDEWMELYNPGGNTVDVSGWQITKATPLEELMLTLPPNSLISAGGFFVISNFGAAGSVLAMEPNLVDPSITLSNSQLLIRIYSGDFTDPTNLVDTAGNGGLPPAGDNATKSSMERAGDDWQTAASALNLDVGVIDLATPGAENSDPVVPPTLASITPSVAVAGTDFTTTITGAGFSTTGTVTLALQSGDTQLIADGVVVDSPTLISSAHWSIELGAVGTWDLILTNPDGGTATLPGALSVTPPPEDPEDPTPLALVLNELLPRPATSASDEFIEIQNTTAASGSLAGWQLDDVADGGSAPFIFGDLPIAPHGFITVYKPVTGITLNDTGDTVRLINPSGLVVDSTIYTAPAVGESWARHNQTWSWSTTPTANSTNIITEPEDDPEDEVEEDTTKSFAKDSIQIVELLPKPEDGDEEFIELRNTRSSSINLKGWRLADASGRSYRFSDDLRLAADEHAAIYQEVSKIHLNDSGGELVTLYDPTNKQIAELGYPDTAPVGVAYIRWEDAGTWAKPVTPAKENPSDLTEIESSVSGWGGPQVLAELPITGWSGWGGGGGILVFTSLWTIMARRRK